MTENFAVNVQPPILQASLDVRHYGFQEGFDITADGARSVTNGDEG